jgi:luciferase family oxidoreductase group 1
VTPPDGVHLMAMVPFSVLDLAPIVVGGDASLALQGSLGLARHVEALGFHRYWLAEHHNMPGIASAATAVVIGHVAAGTRTLRVGAGGVMLPNHSPLVIAEQFGTLAALFPGRIDLGLGRAPGTDAATARALRRDRLDGADTFPEDVLELRSYFAPPRPGQRVRAVPGAGLQVPLWILGSSLFGAQLAAQLGLPYAFASHFAPGDLEPALMLYRRDFRPSAQLARPYVMLAFNVFAADRDEDGERLMTSVAQAFINLRRGEPGPLPPPVDSMEGHWTELERLGVESALSCSVSGSPSTVRRGLREFLERWGPDELMITSHIFDPAARRRSFEIVAEVRQRG